MTTRTESRVFRSTAVVLVALGAAVVGACRQAPPAAAKAASPDAWAVIDGREISKDDVDKAYMASVDAPPTPPSPDEVLTVKLNVLEELITQDILLARARALGVDATDAEVDKALADRRGGMTDAAFQLQVSQRGMSVDDVRRGLRRELTVQKVLDRDVTAKVAVSDQDVADFYTQNRAQFNITETQYRLAQIVITPVRDPQLRNRKNDDAGTPDEARKKTEMLAARLKSGEDFATLALDYSEDPQTAPQGGDLGFVPASALSRVAPALREAVIRMEPGNVNTITNGPNVTILLLVSREAPWQRELSTPSVRDGIRDMLRGRKQQLIHTAYLAAARSDAHVTNYLARHVLDVPAAPPTMAPTAPGKP